MREHRSTLHFHLFYNLSCRIISSVGGEVTKEAHDAVHARIAALESENAFLKTQLEEEQIKNVSFTETVEEDDDDFVQVDIA